ncbi:nuclear transport factor 2 family protein [Streptomyces sp. NPDC004629]|uniref:nuclear transport factor 2 family protein n=1 Tax=Streptomyces sp. NPDC004629 TaxID=3364705 RepID=UPI0036A6C1DE
MPADTARAEDIVQINDTVSRVAYVLDAHDYDRMGEVFAHDVHFENPGRLVADGLAELIKAFQGIASPAVSHHITNVLVTDYDGTHANCVMKALTLRTGGVITSAEYRDTLRKDPEGWRITSRVITPLG